MNLERALRTKQIDPETYQNEKERIEEQISKVYDDGKTCSNGSSDFKSHIHTKNKFN